MQRALLLDKNYMVLSLVTWQKAFKLMVKGKAEPVAGCNAVRSIRGAERQYSIPSILRLLVVVPWKAHQSGGLRFSRKNILIRDNNECKYCGIKVSRSASTIDHVIPKSRGGKTDYSNCVTCCKACNGKKGNKTPSEAKMILISGPKNPTFFDLYKSYFESLDHLPKEWADYIIGLQNENNF